MGRVKVPCGKKAKKVPGFKKAKKIKQTQTTSKPAGQATVQQTGYRPMKTMEIDDIGHLSGRKRKSVFQWLCLSIVCCTLALVLSLVVACACIYNPSLYLVELSSNASTPVQVYLGYLGTCVTVDPGVNNKTECIPHIKFDDESPLSNQFLEGLPGVDAGAANATLSEMLAMVLREDVFPKSLPITFLFLFFISTIVFWFLSAAPARTRAYKGAFAFMTIANGYGLTVGFMMALATLQASRCLKFPAREDGALIGGSSDVVVGDSTTFQALQWLICAAGVLVQLSIAVLFVRCRRKTREAEYDLATPPNGEGRIATRGRGVFVGREDG